MSKKIISFLGVSAMRPATYRWQDAECHSPFMAEAVAQFFPQHQLLVLVTDKANETNWPALKARVGDRGQHIAVPAGQSEDELWQIFNVIAGLIEQDDEIVFDITNGFRSIPLLAFLAVSFVRVVRSVTVSHILYGAFEAKDMATDITPVFDLTPFARLLDWTTATDAFIKYGRADKLSALIAPTAAIAAPALPTHLSSTLKTLTDALQTTRPSEVMLTAMQLQSDIIAWKLSATAQHQPFTLLLNQIQDEYGPMHFNAPQDVTRAHEVLVKHYEMILWYGLYVHAITMAREWLVSLVVADVGGDLYSPAQRQLAEKALNQIKKLTLPSLLPGELAPRIVQLNLLTNHAELLRSWNLVRWVRNDLAHTGISPAPLAASDVIHKVNSAISGLAALLPQDV